MKHLKNIAELFNKNFIEHPLLETFDVGNIVLPTGKLVASDPLIMTNVPSFTINFPNGEFPVLLHKESESNCIAYLEVIFSKELIVEWEMATLEGQKVEDLQKDEIFGFPVQSGMGCIMDAKTQDDLNELEERLYKRKGADFMGIYEEFFHDYFFDQNGAIDQYAFLKPNEKGEGTIFAFEAGYGEGLYASYIGFDNQKKPVKFVTEFIEILN